MGDWEPNGGNQFSRLCHRHGGQIRVWTARNLSGMRGCLHWTSVISSQLFCSASSAVGPTNPCLWLYRLSVSKSRCPKEVCAKARPFEGDSEVVETTTTSTPTTTTEAGEEPEPPIHQQICIQAAIKNNFYSVLGNQYCIDTCQGRPMDECNLYLCYCTTQWLSTKHF